MAGARLQAARKRLFEREPWCEPCKRAGRLTPATLRDHRIPLAEGGADDESNEQAICKRCHRAKTHAESMRGQARARGSR
jgi:5-methylcytosine-specific restriction protein A